MSLIDDTYFKGDLNIPNTSSPAVAERLEWFIDKYETEFLEDLWGAELYASYTDDATVSRWTDLINGVAYSYNGKQHSWKGLKKAIACYVYYYWLRDQATVNTQVGVVKPSSENASNADGSYKMVRAWNEMSDIVMRMYYYMRHDNTLYPELLTYSEGFYFTPYFWWPSISHYHRYGRLNTMGI